MFTRENREASWVKYHKTEHYKINCLLNIFLLIIEREWLKIIINYSNT